MIAEITTRILPTRKFKETFYQCFSRRPKSLRIVSPFVDKLPGFDSVVHFSQLFLKDENVFLQLTTCPPSDHRREFLSLGQAEALIKLGVDLRIRSNPTLHSKVYQFKFNEGDSAAFVGSANFTLGGFKRNDESVAYFRSEKENRLVEAELNRLTDYGTDRYLLWRAYKFRTREELTHE